MKNQLDELRLDLLKEIGNIGIGNAATSLSRLLKDVKVTITLPEVKVVSLGELPDHMGGADEVVAGVFIEVIEELHMYMVFILPLDDAKETVRVVTEGYTGELDEMGLSALMEVSNIVTGGYLTAFSQLVDRKLVPRPPYLAVDLTEAILGTILAEVELAEDFVIFVKTAFNSKDLQINGFLTLIPAKESLDSVYEMFMKEG